MKCDFFLGGGDKNFYLSSFLENSDKSSLKTRDQQTTHSLESFTIKVQKVCRTENSKARWHWEEEFNLVISWSVMRKHNGNIQAQCRVR